MTLLPYGGGENIIVEGHGRLLACQQLGIKEVPVIRLDDLTEEERRAYTLAHNKLTMNTGFDMNMLALEIEKISLDMGDYGFDNLEIDDEGFGTDFELPDGEKGELEQITFTVHNEQAKVIRNALAKVGECSQTFGNTNKNGNAIYEVCKQWAELKR